MSEDAKTRGLDKISRLATTPGGLVAFWDQATEVLQSTVPHYTFPCWYTVDPASLLITSHYNPFMPELPPGSLALEYYTDDANQIVDVARTEAGLSTLHEATNGDPSGSPRWQANIQMGGDQEMVAALRTKTGEVWGAVGLYREADRPMFDDAEKRFVQEAAPYLAEGARTSLLFGEALDPEGPDAPGLLILTSDGQVESSTSAAQQWLDDLPDGDVDTGQLPSVVLTVAGRALRNAEGREDQTGPAMARVLTRSGTWVVLHGAQLQSGAESRVAVIVEPAHPARITSLLLAVYGLTDRERDLTQLVLQGFSTADIAADLVVSPHTVQQHLKSIFDKTGVRSRRDLVAKVFFTHYEPRLRDNERRIHVVRPLRGGPALPLPDPSQQRGVMSLVRPDEGDTRSAERESSA